MSKNFYNYVKVVYSNKDNIIYYFFISILITILFRTILCIMVAQYLILQESLSESPNNISQFLKQTRIINIRHPGYSKDEALLLVLYGYDDPEGSISFDIALAACAIVACNRFDGWILRDNSKEVPKLADVSLLPPGEYWFHVPIDDGNLKPKEKSKIDN